MTQNNKNFCFCTLALGSKYRLMAKQLAEDIDRYSPGTLLIVATDDPNDFKDCKNISAFKFQQKGILYCFNDRRFVIERALLNFETAIHIDSDTKLIANIPDNLEYSSGIVGCHQNLIEHVSKYRPNDLELIKKLASKLNIFLDNVNWIGESLYIVTRDNGKEKEFLENWGLIASYLELNGMYTGDGNVMGLAAAKVGWKVQISDSWQYINQIRQHLDASYEKKQDTFLDSFKRRLKYHYRLNKARLEALKNFDFYYRDLNTK